VPAGKNFAGVDLGTENLAAIACTDGYAAVYKGGAVLSENRLFAKEKAEAVSIITRGHSRMHASSHHLDFISRKHGFFMKDIFHKTTTDLVLRLKAHHVGTVVVGCNKFWKQSVRLGKQNDQNFVSVPHDRFRQMFAYKALRAGITVIEQEESYTSKADLAAGDYIPTYGVDDEKAAFSGYRIKRGLYRTHDGQVLNADCMAAANILRKAFPDVWKGHTDFSFLKVPYSIDLVKLDHKRSGRAA